MAAAPAAAARAAFDAATAEAPLNVVLVGRDTALLANVGALLGAELGYTPLSTTELLAGVANMPVEELVQAQGVDAALAGEGSVFEALSTQIRLVVSTWGEGATQRADEWRWLHGGVVVHVTTGEPSGACLRTCGQARGARKRAGRACANARERAGARAAPWLFGRRVADARAPTPRCACRHPAALQPARSPLFLPRA